LIAQVSTNDAYSRHVVTGNAILVNRNQQSNPVLKKLRNVNYRFAEIAADFQFNDKVRLPHPCMQYLYARIGSALMEF
jgi:hypothetical protein